MDTSRKWLSPPMLMATAAMMVALAAMIVALAGTAGAGPLASSSKLNKSEKKQVKRIVSSQLKKLTFSTETQPVSIPAGGNGSISASCLGEKVVAGGGGPQFFPPTHPDNFNMQLRSSAPMVAGRSAGDGELPDAWRAVFHNSGPTEAFGTAYAICENIP